MQVKRYARPLVCAAVLLLCAALSAQQEPTYTIRVNSNLVQISVVAHDRNGRFVRDLTADEFELMEDRHPQQLSAVDLETVRVSDGAELPKPPLQLPLLSSSTTTPSIVARGLRLVVLFFDFTLLDLPGAARSLRAAEAYIQTMGPADRVAVVSFTPKLKVHQDFTGDQADLQRVLNRLHGLSHASLEGPDDPSYRLFYAYERLRSLRVLTTALANVPQKKSVVIFGGGTDSDADRVGITATVDAAVRAGVSFYGIDAAGLTAAPPLGDAARASSFGRGVLSGVAVVAQGGRAIQDQDLLYALARGTGGRAFFDSNDFERPFRTLEADTREYYLLSYRSSNSQRDGHFRHISVRIRRRGVELKHQAGYYGARDAAAISAHDTERLIAAELAADLPSTSLPVYGFVNHLRVDKELYFLPITVLVPAEALLNNGSASSATVGLAVLDSRGHLVRKLRDVIPAAVNAHPNHAVQYETAAELPSGEYNLRIAVVQNGNGQVGSFSTPIRLPRPDHSRLSVGPLLSGTLTADTPKSAKSPLVVNGSRLIVNPLSAYKANHELTMQYQVECGPEACEPKETRSSLQCFSSDQPVFKVESPASTISGAAAVFRVNFPASSLRPGTYTCRVTAINLSANAFAFGSMQLRILEESQAVCGAPDFPAKSSCRE